jgi:5'-3' exoribonuclease 1
MGVPWFFKSIIQKHPHLLTKDLTKCGRLFLDFNSIIHVCSAQIIENFSDDIENRIFKSITDHVNLLLSKCKPSILLFIAVDGVACLAKQSQQRKRRYLSALRSNMINEYKRRNNIKYTQWDSNCITPGTEFMIKLDKYLTNFYKDDISVIFSGHNDEGEGEHKIIKYIKTNILEDNIDVIYGLDADLIFLSLSCERSNIYLMREMPIGLEYLNIDELSLCVSKYLYDSEDKRYMYDYIFICFLLGNDFLPGLSFLKLKNDALTIICDIYKKLNSFIIIKTNTDFTIDHIVLNNLFDALSKIENNLMKEVFTDYYNLNYKPMYTNKTLLSKFIHEFDNYPLINKYDENIINPVNDPKWIQNYYYQLFNSKDISVINAISKNYIEGLLWTTNYYFNMKADIGWYYKYNYAPSINDIFKCSHIINISHLQNELKESKIILNAHKQLLTVIPPASITLIPEKLRPIMNDINYGCLHYYPHKFCLHTFLKYAYHECIPILPSIHFETLYEVYEKLSVTL